MLRKAPLTAIALFAALLTAGPAFAAQATYKVDPVHSAVVFRIRHLGIGWVYGRINNLEGQYVLDEENAGKSRILVKLASRDVDTNTPKRDEHLRSPDFFNAAKYPEISFESRKVSRNGDGSFQVTGDITLLGVTRPVSVTVYKTGEGDDPWGGHRTGFATRFTVLRSDFGMTTMLDGMVGDAVQLMIAVEGVRQ